MSGAALTVVLATLFATCFLADSAAARAQGEHLQEVPFILAFEL